ncbi:MAG: hypothetical protein SFY67_12625 [Candidatus Melainabacteria bacterium]|nr:hypothetical protein [Candidatus Melainabacteria bacterium]
MKAQIIEAIRELNFKVVPEDVALKTGLPVLAVTGQLNQIATEAHADLKVSNAGKIEYIFKPTFQSEFLLNSMRKTSSHFCNLVMNIMIVAAKLIHLAALALFRASVGLLMIGSVVAVIIFILIAIFKRLEHGPEGAVDVLTGDAASTSSVGWVLLAILHFFRFFLTDWIYDWWFWDRYYMGDYKPFLPRKKAKKQKHYFYSEDFWVDSFFDFSQIEEHKDFQKEKTRKQKRAGERFDFLTICFQFVFGATDLNLDLDERNWKYIAATIKNNNGVVVAEQIAPYLDDISTDSEYWMIPVLNRFQGLPEVSDSGNIIYVFPQFRPIVSDVTPKVVPFNQAELQNLYDDARKRRSRMDLPKVDSEEIQVNQTVEVPGFKVEEIVPFVDFDSNRLFGAILMALIEICGAVYLFININAMPWLVPYEPLITFMLVYGLLFLTVPAIRYFVLLQANKKREARNSKRFDSYAKLHLKKGRVFQKLKEAEGLRNAVEVITGNACQTVYTTDKDLLDQQF